MFFIMFSSLILGIVYKWSIEYILHWTSIKPLCDICVVLYQKRKFAAFSYSKKPTYFRYIMIYLERERPLPCVYVCGYAPLPYRFLFTSVLVDTGRYRTEDGLLLLKVTGSVNFFVIFQQSRFISGMT